MLTDVLTDVTGSVLRGVLGQAVGGPSAGVDVADLAAEVASLPLSGGTIRVNDNSTYGLSPITLVGRAFTGPVVIEPVNWTDNADPRLVTRSCVLPKLTIGTGMQNLTIQGFEIQHTSTSYGSNAVVEVQKPSLNVTIRKCEVWDKDLETEFTSGRMESGSMDLINGIACLGGSGSDHLRLRIEENHVHDVLRGIIMNNTAQNGSAERSRVRKNYIMNCYQYFTEGGTVTETDYIDNRGYGVWSIPSDRAVPPSNDGIHMSVGGAFNPNCNDVKVIGNIFHEGTRRKEIDPTFTSGATGIKFNDPALGNGATAYQNIEVAFNLVVAALGAGIEVSGGTNVDIHHNTVLAESYQASSFLSIVLGDVTNCKVWNNISNAYDIDSQDGTYTDGVLPNNGNVLGYGNLSINRGNAEAYDDGQYFTGDVNPIPLSNLSLDDLETIYTPVAGTQALDATQPKGALGHSLYVGDGVLDSAADWNPPVSATSGASSYTPVRFNGTNNYLSWSGATSGMMGSSKEFIIAMRLRRHASGVQYLLDTQAGRARVWLDGGGYIEWLFEGSDSAEVITGRTGFHIPLDGEFHDVVLAVKNERMVMALDGILDPHFQDASRFNVVRDRSTYFAGNIYYIGAAVVSGPADYFSGDLEFIWVGLEFADIEEDTDYSAFFDSTGRLRDPGSTGANYTGTQPELFVHGDATTINTNAGSGPNFTKNGTFTDSDLTAATLSSPASSASGPTSGTLAVDTNDSSGTMFVVVTQSATAPSKYQVRQGLDENGASADYDTSQAASGTGMQTFAAATGLSSSTTYYAYFTQVDDGGNLSTVVSDSFTTAAPYVGLAQSSSTTARSATVPASPTSGNLLIAYGGARDGTSLTAGTTPSGWTELHRATGSTSGRVILGKVSDGTEGGSSVELFGADADGMVGCVIELEVNETFTSIAGSGGVGTVSVNDPPSVTILGTAATKPYVAIGFHATTLAETAIDDDSFTGAVADITETVRAWAADGDSQIIVRAKLVKAADTAADATIDMGDHVADPAPTGASNHMAGVAIELS